MLSRCWDSATREIKPKMPLHSSKHYGTIAISQFWFQQVNLALSANLSKWLYVLLALISFFLIFFNDSWRQIISGYAGPIFAIFSPNESVLGADDRSGPIFWYLKGRCHGNQFWAKLWQNYLPHPRTYRTVIPKQNRISFCGCTH